MSTPTTTAGPPSTLAPTTSGTSTSTASTCTYETYGTGAPLVLLHGGMLSIDLDFGALLPGLAETRTVVGIELQGHGRTPDTERDITFAHHASDVVALLDHLGHERATVLGHSMGGGVALELAVHHPDRVDAVVAVSASVRPDGLHPDLGDPSTYATSTIMPTADDFAAMRAEYERLSPHPERFDDVHGPAERVPGGLLRRLDRRAARRRPLPGPARPGRPGLHDRRARRAHAAADPRRAARASCPAPRT